MSNKLKVVIYQDGVEIFKEECNAYLTATSGDETDLKCSIIASSEKNMRNLVAGCMASAFGVLTQKGTVQEDIDEFFKEAIDTMFRADQVIYNQVKANEPLQ